MDGRVLRFPCTDIVLRNAHRRGRRLPLARHEGPRSRVWRHTRRIRADLPGTRLSPARHGECLVESRRFRRRRLGVVLASRRPRRHHDDRHAKLERRGGDHARRPGRRQYHLSAGLRSCRRAEHWNGRDQRRAWRHSRRPCRASHGLGAHHIQPDCRRPWHASPCAAGQCRDLGRLLSRRLRRRSGACRFQQPLQAHGSRGFLPLAELVCRIHREAFGRGRRHSALASRPGAVGGRGTCRPRSRVARRRRTRARRGRRRKSSPRRK